MQYGDDLYAKSCKAADVYNESRIKQIFINGVNSSIFDDKQEHWATHQHAVMTDIGFMA